MGSGNGLARTLGIPLTPDRALAALAEAVPRAMDVGMINGRPFLNVAGAGFDAQVGLDFHEHGRRGGRRGLFTYVRLSVARAVGYRAETWVLDAGGQRFEGRAFVVAFVNGRQYGGGAILVPGARLDDGLLDVVVIEDAPWFELTWNAMRLFTGGIEGYRRYRHFAAAAAVLTVGRPRPASPRRGAGGAGAAHGDLGAAAGATDARAASDGGRSPRALRSRLDGRGLACRVHQRPQLLARGGGQREQRRAHVAAAQAGAGPPPP